MTAMTLKQRYEARKKAQGQDTSIYQPNPLKGRALGALCDDCPMCDPERYRYVSSQLPKNRRNGDNGSGVRQVKGIIGIAPGADEARFGTPFIGPSGKLLDSAMESTVLVRDDLFISNIVSCKLPGNREPTSEEIACCAPRLKAELEQENVGQVLVLGKPPRDILIKNLKSKAAGSTRGVWYDMDFEHLPGMKIDCLHTWHPAYILRGNYTQFKTFEMDLKKFCRPRHPKIDLVEREYYEVVSDVERLKEVVATALRQPIPLCFDLETSNIGMELSLPSKWWEGYVLCFALGWEGLDFAFIVDEQLFNTKAALRELLKLFYHKHGVYGHNVKFDIHYMLHYFSLLEEEYDDVFENFWLADDTLLMHYCLEEIKGTHGLKNLASHYFDSDDYEAVIHKYLKRPRVESYAKVPRPVLYKYAAYDIWYTTRLRTQLLQELLDDNLYERPYKLILVPALNAISRQEHLGMDYSEEKLAYARDRMFDEVEKYKELIRDEAGKPDLNPNAPAQLATVLYDELRLPMPRATSKIKPRSTNKAALATLEGKHPIIEHISKYRRWSKLYSTYATKIWNFVGVDDRVHFEFNLAGTETGRVSAGILITMPRKFTPEGKLLRDSFQTRKGRILIGADFSQAELRWGGWYAQEPFLYDVYNNDRDLHTEVAVAMYGENFTKEERIYTKMFNFSYLYGGTEYSFAQDAGLPIAEAKIWVARYNDNMPHLAQWKDHVFNQVKTRGWLITPTGRKRRFDIITNANAREVRNEATNFPPSSASSDTTMLGYVRTYERCKREGIPIIPVLFMHDGVYFECEDNKTVYEEAAGVMREEMLSTAYYLMDNAGEWYPEEFGGNEPIKFKVDVEYGYSWGSMDDLEI